MSIAYFWEVVDKTQATSPTCSLIIIIATLSRPNANQNHNQRHLRTNCCGMGIVLLVTPHDRSHIGIPCASYALGICLCIHHVVTSSCAECNADVVVDYYYYYYYELFVAIKFIAFYFVFSSGSAFLFLNAFPKLFSWRTFTHDRWQYGSAVAVDAVCCRVLSTQITKMLSWPQRVWNITSSYVYWTVRGEIRTWRLTFTVETRWLIRWESRRVAFFQTNVNYRLFHETNMRGLSRLPLAGSLKKPSTVWRVLLPVRWICTRI